MSELHGFKDKTIGGYEWRYIGVTSHPDKPIMIEVKIISSNDSSWLDFKLDENGHCDVVEDFSLVREVSV